MNLFNKMFSIDEFRVSALVVFMFLIIGAIIYSLYSTGSIPYPLVDLAQSLIYSIAGVNVFSGISTMIKNSCRDLNSNTHKEDHRRENI